MNKNLSKDSFTQEVIDNKNLSIVQFRKEWNGACQILEPIYQDLARSFEGKVDFFEVDLDNQQSLEMEYGITELPTIYFFDHGQLIDYTTGLIPKDFLLQKIEQALMKHQSFGQQ